MKTFEELGLAPALLQAVADLGFQKPTPVQGQVIPALLNGHRDLVALAQTGTGKTAAFGLPMIQRTDLKTAKVQGLILCPTRELCVQIARDLAALARQTPGLRVVPVYGGAPIDGQLRGLDRGAHIVVATPGRMNDVLRRRPQVLSTVRRVALDEADEMLNMGFQEDLESILKAAPDGVQTLLFSATMPPQVATIASKYMRDPEEIVVGRRNAGAENIRHECYVVHARDRYPALKRILDFHRNLYGIVFCRTRIETQEVATRLMADGYSADTLHGDLSQVQRDRVMKNFRDRNIRLLVATDVAARGLDVDDLTHVIHYNLPDMDEHYTHRSGRTGRAGKAGISIALVHMREEYKIRALERMLKQKFVRKPVPTGREVCEARLMDMVERLQNLDADDPRADAYLPAIEKKLSGLSREELIRRFVLQGFDQLLSYYQNAPDLNVPIRHEVPGRAGGGRPAYGRGDDGAPRDGDEPVRLQINLGLRNGLTPSLLITLINRATPGPMVRIGRIHIVEHTTVFQAGPSDAAMLAKALNGEHFQGREILVKSLGPGRPEKRPLPAFRGGRPSFHGHGRPKGHPATHRHAGY